MCPSDAPHRPREVQLPFQITLSQENNQPVCEGLYFKTITAFTKACAPCGAAPSYVWEYYKRL